MDAAPGLSSSGRLGERGPQPQAGGDQLRQVLQGNHIGAVAQRLIGAWMRLDEDAVTTARHRGLGEEGDHAAIAGRTVTPARWFLYAVGRVKDHGAAEFLHDRNGAEIVD